MKHAWRVCILPGMKCTVWVASSAVICVTRLVTVTLKKHTHGVFVLPGIRSELYCVGGVIIKSCLCDTFRVMMT